MHCGLDTGTLAAPALTVLPSPAELHRSGAQRAEMSSQRALLRRPHSDEIDTAVLQQAVQVTTAVSHPPSCTAALRARRIACTSLSPSASGRQPQCPLRKDPQRRKPAGASERRRAPSSPGLAGARCGACGPCAWQACSEAVSGCVQEIACVRWRFLCAILRATLKVL